MPSLVIVIATWASGGNLPPLLALAGLLRAAGHRVHVLSSDATREPALRDGFEPFAYRTAPQPDTSVPFEERGGGTAAHAGVEIAHDVSDVLEEGRPTSRSWMPLARASACPPRPTGSPRGRAQICCL